MTNYIESLNKEAEIIKQRIHILSIIHKGIDLFTSMGKKEPFTLRIGYITEKLLLDKIKEISGVNVKSIISYAGHNIQYSDTEHCISIYENQDAIKIKNPDWNICEEGLNADHIMINLSTNEIYKFTNRRYILV